MFSKSHTHTHKHTQYALHYSWHMIMLWQSNNFHVTGHLWKESANVCYCFTEQIVEQTVELLVIIDALTFMSHLVKSKWLMWSDETGQHSEGWELKSKPHMMPMLKTFVLLAIDLGHNEVHVTSFWVWYEESISLQQNYGKIADISNFFFFIRTY